MPVSVIMPAFNAGRYIAIALASLLQERGAVNLDIIVVDDGSTDDTRDIVAGIAAQHSEVRLLHNPRKGIAAARNTGLDAVREDCGFITFLDADDASVNGRIARQRGLFLADPSIDVIYGRIRIFRDFDDAALEPRKVSFTKVIRGPYLQSAMYRPAVFARVGRFDETYRQGCDTDFVLRVLDSGARLVLDDGIAAYYRRHDANVTLNTAEMHREFTRATLKWALRNKLKGGGGVPEIYRDLMLSRQDIEKGFEE